MSSTRPKKQKSVKEKLQAARLPEDSIDIYLRGDLLAEIRALDDELAALARERLQDKRLGDGPVTGEEQAKATKVKALQDELEESKLTLRLRAHRRSAWRQLVAEHPPREKRREDQVNGVNTDTFFPIVIREGIIAPALDDDDWAVLEDISDGEWQRLMNLSFSLNRDQVNVPFSRRASLVLQSAADDSSQPEPSGSASDA